ncbi:MAG TPA: TIR domain-containing protein [Candidatus Angelobacter sp.]
MLLEEEVSQVFVDWHRLQGGDFFNAKLAHALCQSVCMVAVYTPTYFSLVHPYCAREYRAMEKLEDQRLAALNRKADREHGLIIPIVLRYKDRLPKKIKSKRQFYDFEAFLQGDNQIVKPEGYFKAIKEIASYIAERYWEISGLPQSASNCSGFDFPSESQIRPWLRKLTATPGTTNEPKTRLSKNTARRKPVAKRGMRGSK